MGIASTTDVTAQFRALTSAESVVADTLLVQAEALLATKVVALRERYAAAVDGSTQKDADFVTLVKGTIVASVVRVLRNPEGLREFRVDDAGFTRDQLLSAGLLVFTKDEVTSLQPESLNTGGIFTIGLGG